MAETVVIRISKKVHDDALKVKEKRKTNYMDKKSWFSFLIEKGMTKLNEEREHAA